MKNTARYKIDGEYVILPKRTKEEQKAYRKEWNRKWIAENPDKVKANTKRFMDSKRKKK